MIATDMMHTSSYVIVHHANLGKSKISSSRSARTWDTNATNHAIC